MRCPVGHGGVRWAPLGPVAFFGVVGLVALASAAGLALLAPRVGRMEQAA